MLNKYLKVPNALSIQGWAKWRKKTKKDHPIAYFFYDDFSSFFRSKKYWCERKYWYLQHKYNPKHKYHLLDTGLPVGYHDPSEQIKEGMFKLVCRYVDNNHFDWDGDYDSCKARIDLQNVADWVNIYRPRLQKRLDTIHDEYDLGMGNYFEHGTFCPDDRDTRQVLYIEAKILRIDKKMMHLVVDHNELIWY